MKSHWVAGPVKNSIEKSHWSRPMCSQIKAKAAAAATEADGRTVAVGMLMVFLSGLLFSVMSVFVTIASARGVGAMQIVLISGVVRWAGLALAVVQTGESPFATAAVRSLLLMRSFCGFTAFSSATYAFGLMTIGDATAIFLTSPIWAALLGRLVLGEPLGLADCVAILLCLSGVLLVMRPTAIFGIADLVVLPANATSNATMAVASSPDEESVLFPSLVVLFGAVFAASVAVLVRLIQRRGGAHPAVIAHAYALFTALVSLPLCYVLPGQAFVWQGVPVEAWAACVGVGLLAIPNQLLINAGLQRTPAGLGAMMRLIDVPAAFAIQVLAFDQPPNPLSVLGSAVILATCATTAYRKWKAGDRRSRLAAVTAATGSDAAAQPSSDARSRADEAKGESRFAPAGATSRFAATTRRWVARKVWRPPPLLQSHPPTLAPGLLLTDTARA